MSRLYIRGPRSLRPYHVFNQGSKRGRRSPRPIFIDREDKRYFLGLLARHLGLNPSKDSRGRAFQHLREKIVLLAFNVMATHFHLIVWQRDEQGIAELMNRVKAAYTRYFNDKYGDTGPLSNGPVQAKPITSKSYFRWLVGYVHKNHRSDEWYEFSSHRAWVDESARPGWLSPQPAIAVFGSIDDYIDYLAKYDDKIALDKEFGHRRS
ncbi:MAG: transposase [Solirubrobacterales bacterium]